MVSEQRTNYLDVTYQKKIGADVWRCIDCGAVQFALVANTGDNHEEGDVVCLQCGEAFPRDEITVVYGDE